MNGETRKVIDDWMPRKYRRFRLTDKEIWTIVYFWAMASPGKTLMLVRNRRPHKLLVGADGTIKPVRQGKWSTRT